MRRRGLLIVLAGVAVATATPALAGPKVKVILTFEQYTPIGTDEVFIVGDVRSDRKRCKRNRRVRLTGRDAGSDQRVLLDTDNTEQFAKAQFRVDQPVPDLIRLDSKRRKFRNGLICKAARSDEFATP